MKRVLSACLVLLWAPAIGAAGPTGGEILRKSRETYVGIRSYVGTTTVKARMVISAATVDQTASAKITFLRPRQVRIEGRDTQGQPFSIISDGTDTWLAWAFQADGTFQRAESLEMAISSMTGVAAQAPTIIPAALAPLAWGNPWLLTADAQLVGREKVGGHDCYKIVSKTPPGAPGAGMRTYWVDTRSLLLRQLKEEQDEQDLAEMQAAMRRLIEERFGRALAETEEIEKLKGMFKAPALRSRETVHSFRIEKINAAVDKKLFQVPTEVQKP